MKVEVIFNKKTVSMDMAATAKFGELMQSLNIEEGIEVSKQVILFNHKQLRMPAYENGKLVIYDGKERTTTEDLTLSDLKIDGTEPLVCGELQDEWLEDMKWGAFSHTIYEADYLKHREYIVFNAQQQH